MHSARRALAYNIVFEKHFLPQHLSYCNRQNVAPPGASPKYVPNEDVAVFSHRGQLLVIRAETDEENKRRRGRKEGRKEGHRKRNRV